MSKDNSATAGAVPIAPEQPAPDATRCACIHFDARDCWRLRYNLHWSKSVEEDGGPCQCSCHDDVDQWDDESEV